MLRTAEATSLVRAMLQSTPTARPLSSQVGRIAAAFSDESAFRDNANISSREGEIASRDADIASRDAEIASRDADIASRDAEIALLRALIVCHASQGSALTSL